MYGQKEEEEEQNFQERMYLIELRLLKFHVFRSISDFTRLATETLRPTQIAG